VLRANAAARAAFGAEIAAVLRHPDLRAAIDRAFSGGDAPDGGNLQAADLTLAAAEREVRAMVRALDPPLADGGAALVLLSDRSAERALDRARADFVANASHELRTPLAALIGFTDTLRGPAADDREAQARFLAIMAEQGARMNRLIDDLLSLSRIEMTERQPPTARVALPPLLDHALAAFDQRLAARHMTLDRAVAEGLPELRADADQLGQVLANLLENAVKYGREGGTLRVAARLAGPDDPVPGGVALAVTDDGAGIPREHLPRLTERFYRVDAGRSRAAGGTGLGLAIVKHIVQRHRGVLRIDSEVGKGTTVTVWLPVAV